MGSEVVLYGQFYLSARRVEAEQTRGFDGTRKLNLISVSDPKAYDPKAYFVRMQVNDYLITRKLYLVN